MSKFKTTSRGGAKFVYTPLKSKKGKIYAWKEKNLKTEKSKRVEYSKVKIVFASEYDKSFAKRISKRKKGKVMNYRTALSRIKSIRKKGGSFDELY